MTDRHLAYDPTTGHLVYDPASGHLALNCGAAWPIYRLTDCLSTEWDTRVLYTDCARSPSLCSAIDMDHMVVKIEDGCYTVDLADGSPLVYVVVSESYDSCVACLPGEPSHCATCIAANLQPHAFVITPEGVEVCPYTATGSGYIPIRAMSGSNIEQAAVDAVLNGVSFVFYRIDIEDDVAHSCGYGPERVFSTVHTGEIRGVSVDDGGPGLFQSRYAAFAELSIVDNIDGDGNKIGGHLGIVIRLMVNTRSENNQGGGVWALDPWTADLSTLTEEQINLEIESWDGAIFYSSFGPTTWPVVSDIPLTGCDRPIVNTKDNLITLADTCNPPNTTTGDLVSHYGGGGAVSISIT